MSARIELPRLLDAEGRVLPLPILPVMPCAPSVPGIPSSVTANWRLPVVLRPFQEEFLRRWLNKCHGSLVAATGVGKTFAGVAAIVTLKTPTLVFVPTLALADQWVAVLRSTGIDAGLWTGEQKNANWVTVSLYATLFDKPGMAEPFPFILADEADMMTASEWGRLLTEGAKHPYLMLLTATEPEDHDRRILMRQAAPPLLTISTAEGIRMGLLVPPQITPLMVPLSSEEQELYDDAQTRLSRASRTLGTSDPREVARMTRSPNEQLRAAAFGFFKATNDRKRVLAETQTKPAAVLELVRAHPGEKFFLFGTLIDPLENMCRYLTEHGVPCRIISGRTGKRERAEILELFKTSPLVLASSAVLKRGIDVPSAAHMVIVGAPTSKVSLTQTLGRVLRPSPGKESAVVYVVASEGTSDERLVERIREVAGQG